MSMNKNNNEKITTPIIIMIKMSKIFKKIINK